MKKALVTGCNGLIGSSAVSFLIEKGFDAVGIDNDMRSFFFGQEASTNDVGNFLLNKYDENFRLISTDIRDYDKLKNIFLNNFFDLIIHTAAQPSHDWPAKNDPLIDFSVNATGTLNLLELTRKHSPNAVFIFTSTNKVYGDRPNFLPLRERRLRFDLFDNDNTSFPNKGVNESMSIDNCMHSVFGASKVAADIMCQEYGKYFGIKTGIFRGGCLTGPNHAGTEMHGFLSYLVKCIIHNKSYTIYGYGGKQVRDNIHSKDLLNMFWEFYLNPKPGEVYNVGGGRGNDLSILESISMINLIAGTNWNNYTISDDNRIGDHKWYVTDYSKFKNDYPNWEIKFPIEDILTEMIVKEKKLLKVETI